MFLVWVVLAGLLQVTVLYDLNLLVVLAVFAGLRKGPLLGLLIGSAIGAFAGIFSASALTLNLALYGLVGFASGLARARIYYKENIFMEIVFSFCGLTLFYILYFILTGRAPASVFYIAALSALVSPVLFRILDYRSSGAASPC